MSEVITIGLDIAKNVFHAHGVDARGAMVFSRKLTRAKLLNFFAGQGALEAFGGAHHWAREQQAAGLVFRTRDLLAELNKRVAVLDREIAQRAKEDEAARRLMPIPGIGPIAAPAIIALASQIETFNKARHFAAWLGLAPRQHSTGGKQRLGSISKMGERTIRRLLIIGGSSMVRQACRHGAPVGSWLERILARSYGAAHQGRTGDSIRLRATYPNLSLAFEGASTEVMR